MAKLRSVSVNFWDDPFIEELNTSEKLLFLYLITNDKTNMIGVYESSSKKMSFETGMKIDEINDILKKFEEAKKIKRVGSYVVMLNFIKNQNFNPNMIKSAIDTYNKLPNALKSNDLIIDREDIRNGLERVRKGLQMVRKVEVEYKEEVEGEGQYIFPTIIVDANNCQNEIDELLKDELLLQPIAMRRQSDLNEIKGQLTTFVSENAILKKTWDNQQDFRRHFLNWINKQPKPQKEQTKGKSIKML